MNKKIAIFMFTEDKCKQTHAIKYGLDLNKHGYEVKIVLEGAACQSLRRLEKEEGFAKCFDDALSKGIIAGICKRASGGCSESSNSVVDIVRSKGIKFLDDLDGHASITPFLNDGFQVITF